MEISIKVNALSVLQVLFSNLEDVQENVEPIRFILEMLALVLLVMKEEELIVSKKHLVLLMSFSVMIKRNVFVNLNFTESVQNA